MLIVSDVRESTNFDEKKPFAVVRFRKTAGGSKFAVGNLNSGNVYSSTYNLQMIYPDCKNDDGEFSAKKALKLFKEEMQIGMEEPIDGYDIDVSEISEFSAVKIVATKRIMRTIRPAVYGTKEDALRVAKASLQRQIKAKTFVGMTEEDLEEEEED